MSDSRPARRRLWHVRLSPRELPRWLRIVALVGAGIVAIYLVAALFAPYFFDVDRYRADISDLFSEQMGRRVTLGTIRARIIPAVGFTIDALRVGNPRGFAPGEFISAAGIRGTLAFWPLVLRRELHIKSLDLIRPKLSLLQDERGQNNYTFSPDLAFGASSPAAQAGAPRPVPGTTVLQIDQVTLRGAEVILGGIDERAKVSSTVDAAGFDVTLRRLMLQPARVRDWRVDARLNGAHFKLAGWDAPIAFRTGSATLRDDALESNFSVDFGKAAHISGTFSVPDVEHAVVKFDLKTDDVDLDALVAGVTVKSGAMKPTGPALGVAAGAGASTANGARVSSGRTTYSNATYNNATANNPIAKNPSVPPLKPPTIAVSGVSSAGIAATAAAASGSELLAEGHVAAERIRSGPQIAGPATADLRVYTDRLEIWPVTAQIGGGTLQLSARTDRRQTPQRFSINVQVRNLNVAEILVTSPALRGKLAGTGELDLQAFGSLDSTLERSLAGNGQFAIRNGRIAGFNLSGVAQSISRRPAGPPAAVLAAPLAPAPAATGDTTFTAIKGDIAIGDERIDSRDMHLDSPRGTADLRGSIGFDGSLSYDGQINALLPGGTGAGGASASSATSNQAKTTAAKPVTKSDKQTVPFALHGTLQNPQLVPSRGAVDFSAPSRPGQKSDSSFPNLFEK